MIGRCWNSKWIEWGTSASLRKPSLSLRAWVLTTQTLAHMLDSLVRVSRRDGYNHLSLCRHNCESRRLKQCCTSVNARPRKARRLETSFKVSLTTVWPSANPHRRVDKPNASPKVKKKLADNTNCNRFPFNDFRSFSLSFQNSFNLSFTVLVRYRSLASI